MFINNNPIKGTKETMSYKRFLKLPLEVKCEAALSDGVFYDSKKLSNTVKDDIHLCSDWLKKAKQEGILVELEEKPGSYRMPCANVVAYYKKNNLSMNQPIASTLFAPRIWANTTEAEGFLSAPLREVAYVTFNCDPSLLRPIAKALKGVARVRYSGISKSGKKKYVAYGLSVKMIKGIIEGFPRDKVSNVRTRTNIMRREIVDFDKDFSDGMISFYIDFAPVLARGHKDTINMFIPDYEDQRSQYTMWVINAIERFKEKESVPFSGYLANVLQRWPYDLPVEEVGFDVAKYQRKRKKYMKKNNGNFTPEELAKEMDVPVDEINDWESQHSAWTAQYYTSDITWEETSDEKFSNGSIFAEEVDNEKDLDLSHNLSKAMIMAVVDSGEYKDLGKMIYATNFHVFNDVVLASVHDKTIDSFKERYIELSRK